MTTDDAIEIEMADPGIADAVAAELADLINHAYTLGEQGLWNDGAARTTPDETARLVRAGEIAVARLHGRIVGAVRVHGLNGDIGEFGMLAADPGLRGAGIGRRLIDFAERVARDRGLDTMRLELLVPKTWTHPSKKFLHEWYTRLGYRVVRSSGIEEQYPHLAPLLATPCDFVIYHKKLDRPRRHGPQPT